MNHELGALAARAVEGGSSDEPAALIRGLKGAASSVLWALMTEGGSKTAVELERRAGYSDKPVRQALAKLEAQGLVEHHGRARGWRMSKQGRNLMLALLVRGGA